MSFSSIVKHTFSNQLPLPSELKVGELALQVYNQQARLFTKDEQGVIVELGQGTFNFADLLDVDLTNLQENSFFIYRNGKFIATNQIGSLTDLTDVEINNPRSKDYLRFDSFTESFRNIQPSYKLGDLVDIEVADSTDSIASLAQDNKVLTYDHSLGKYVTTERRNLINQLDDVEVESASDFQLLTLDTDGLWKNMNLKIERDINPKLGNHLDGKGFAIKNSNYRIVTITANQPIVKLEYSQGDYFVVNGVSSADCPQCVLQLNINPSEGMSALCMLEIRQSSGAILIAGVTNIEYEDAKPIRLSGEGKIDLITVMVQRADYVRKRFYHNATASLQDRDSPIYMLRFPSLAHTQQFQATEVVGSQPIDTSEISPYFKIEDFPALNTLLEYINTTKGTSLVAILNVEDWSDQTGYFAQFSTLRYQNLMSNFDADLDIHVAYYWQIPSDFSREQPTELEVSEIKMNWGTQNNGSSAIIIVPTLDIPIRGKTESGTLVDNVGRFNYVPYILYDTALQTFVDFLNPREYIQYTYTSHFGVSPLFFASVAQLPLVGYGGVVLFPENPTAAAQVRTGFGDIFGQRYFTPEVFAGEIYGYRPDYAFYFTDNDVWVNFFNTAIANFSYTRDESWYTAPSGYQSLAPVSATLLAGRGYPVATIGYGGQGGLVLLSMRLMRDLQRTFTSWRDFIVTWRAQPNYREMMECPSGLLVWESTAVVTNYFSSSSEIESIDMVTGGVPANFNDAGSDLLTPFNRKWSSDEWDRPFDIGRYSTSMRLIDLYYEALNNGATNALDLNEQVITFNEFVAKHGWQSNSFVIPVSTSDIFRPPEPYWYTNYNSIADGDPGGRDSNGNIIGLGWLYNKIADLYKAYVTANALNLAPVGLGGEPAYRYDKNRYPEVQVFDRPNLYDDYFESVRLLLNFEVEQTTGRLWYEDKSDYYKEITDSYLVNSVTTDTNQLAINKYSFGLQEYVAAFLNSTKSIEVTFQETVVLSANFTMESYLSFDRKEDYFSNGSVQYWLYRNQDDSFYLKYEGSSSTSQSIYFELKVGSNVYRFNNAYTYFSNREKSYVHLAMVRVGTAIKFYVDGVNQNPLENVSSSGEVNVASLDIALKGNLNSVRLTEGLARYQNNFLPVDPRFGLLAGESRVHDRIIFNTVYNVGDYPANSDDYVANQMFL